MAENLDRYKERSTWWFILPIFFSLIGGIIAFFAIRGDDPKKAKNCLFLGISLFAIPWIIMGIMMAFFSATMQDFERIYNPPMWSI